MSGFDYNSMMALKDLIGGEEQDPSIVENPYNGEYDQSWADWWRWGEERNCET